MAVTCAIGCGVDDPTDANVEAFRAGTSDGGDGEEPGTSPWCEQALPDLDGAHCDDARRLGFLHDDGGECLDVEAGKGYWQAARLFQTEHVYLDRFCRYQWVPNKVGNAPEPWAIDPIAQHEAECDGVTSDGSVWGDALAPTLLDTFRDHVDYVATPDLATGLPASAVDVIVLDTEYAPVANPHSNHGEIIGKLIEDLACGGGAGCTRQVDYSLAMRRYWDSAGLSTFAPFGGSFGNAGDLSVGLEVAYQMLMASSAERVVVNFSGGWEHRGIAGEISAANQLDVLAGGGPPTLAVADRAVHVSLTMIRCAGGLPIVAAGNRVPDSCEVGPKRPAYWETLPALSQDDCTALAFPKKTKSQTNLGAPGSYEPLVFSVGGVGYEGAVLGNARPQGSPRLAAPGQYGLAPDGGGYTDPLAGTSVSAAVTSATAALIWSYFPDMPAADVMALIYDSGVDVLDSAGQVRTSDYGLNSGEPIHQVGLCSALEAACVDQGVSCALTCDPGSADTAPLLAEIENLLLYGGLQVEPYEIEFRGEAPCSDACSGSPVQVTFPLTAQVSPPIIYPLQTSIPDPSSPSCMSCDLEFASSTSTSGQATLSLDSAYPESDLQGTWIDLYYADGTDDSMYLGGSVSLPLSHTITHTVDVDLPTGAPGVPVAATVVMEFDNGRVYKRSTSIPVLVH